MFPSFTGTARPKRQVNLSGRTSNPFAAVSNDRSKHLPQSIQNTIAQAQQERISRQQERERPPAAIRIQKTWRGYASRKKTRTAWRQEWDDTEKWQSKGRNGESLLQATALSGPYSSDDECFKSLRLLIHFASPRSDHDIQRLYYFSWRYSQSVSVKLAACPSDAWRQPLLSLTRLILAPLILRRWESLPSYIVDAFLSFLRNIVLIIPQQIAPYAREFFRAMAVLTSRTSGSPESIQPACIGLLQANTENIVSIYEAFARELLIIRDLPSKLNGLEVFAGGLSYKALAEATVNIISPSRKDSILDHDHKNSLMWFLAYFIYFRRWTYSRRPTTADSPDGQYVTIMSRMVSFLADCIETPIVPRGAGSRIQPPAKSLPAFVHSQIYTLIDQENVSSLLANIDVTPGSEDTNSETPSEASALANYALTLLRAFPRRGDDIRMWLYLGSTSRQSHAAETGTRLPAIKYFYQVASQTKIYRSISKDPHKTVVMLRPDSLAKQGASVSNTIAIESRDQEWRIILIFLELYLFVLKVMDDEEFLNGTTESDARWSWTRQSALPLNQVKDLTSFLKCLAFSMYYHSSEIAGIEVKEVKLSLAEYFGSHQPQEARPDKFEELSIAGISGMTLAYMKGTVTGVLRMLYERDSRRKFMPRDHWLMSKYFEMDKFIAAVVAEEEHKHKIEESYEDDGDLKNPGRDDSDDDDDPNDYNLIGTGHTQRVRNAERLRIQQRKLSKRRYLEAVTPRLEILQNMPFFIPFTTRVQIFRQFVTLDQVRRRGTSDADDWRFAMMNNPQTIGHARRHQAKVRRENIFDDALAQFYDLGEGLKEPIQIRFVDKFDTIEEGIDGGGVTKEFLTSITNEAFNASNGLEALFIENDQHLLYPNPAAIEERKATLQQALIEERSYTWNKSIRDLERRYEFLGRIIGKCLYEGILVDIHFAPFFLLKWALTGGSTFASKESDYRANLNDLRDLDEGLYQGLLQLKNYTGNVEEFSLNFAVTDIIRTSATTMKSITRELRPGGVDIPVTNENRIMYISYMARYRLQMQPQMQTSAFLKGLELVISPSWLSMFNQSELQTLIGGSSTEISVEDLRSNTQYGGIYSIGDDGLEHPSVQMFWKVMQSLDDADRKKVLKFVTSTPRAPLLGFGNLNPRFSIRDSGSDQTRLPSTSTCVNLLKLPIYRDEKVLRERLLYSVNAGAGFNLS